MQTRSALRHVQWRARDSSVFENRQMDRIVSPLLVSTRLRHQCEYSYPVKATERSSSFEKAHSRKYLSRPRQHATPDHSRLSHHEPIVQDLGSESWTPTPSIQSRDKAKSQEPHERCRRHLLEVDLTDFARSSDRVGCIPLVNRRRCWSQEDLRQACQSSR